MVTVKAFYKKKQNKTVIKKDFNPGIKFWRSHTFRP
jgi:hypothetical protein